MIAHTHTHKHTTTRKKNYFAKPSSFYGKRTLNFEIGFVFSTITVKENLGLDYAVLYERKITA